MTLASMMPEERAQKVCWCDCCGPPDAFTRLMSDGACFHARIVEQIREAIAEEREACATMADVIEAQEHVYQAYYFERPGEQIPVLEARIAKRIATAIRTRT